MKSVFTQSALADLEEILSYTAAHYPSLAAKVEQRLRDVVGRIETWPLAGREVDGVDGVRVVPVFRYPFKIFYRIDENRIEILHIHHVAREPWIG